jgi:hypothetical protein
MSQQNKTKLGHYGSCRAALRHCTILVVIIGSENMARVMNKKKRVGKHGMSGRRNERENVGEEIFGGIEANLSSADNMDIFHASCGLIMFLLQCMIS